MDFRPVKPDQVRYEMRMVQGRDPFEKHQKSPGAFGRFLSGVGRLFGALAMPFSIFCPPAMIGALGMYGLGKVGDQIQYSSYMKQAQQQQTHQAQKVAFPGMEDVFGGPQVTPLSSVQSDVLNVLYARNDMMMESARAIEGR